MFLASDRSITPQTFSARGPKTSEFPRTKGLSPASAPGGLKTRALQRALALAAAVTLIPRPARRPHKDGQMSSANVSRPLERLELNLSLVVANSPPPSAPRLLTARRGGAAQRGILGAPPADSPVLGREAARSFA